MSQVDKVNSHSEQSELIRNTSNPDFDNVEEEANAYFQKIYASDERERLSVDQVIQLLKRLKNSEISREQEIFRSMIHNLFDEYRFFQKYPDPELEVSSQREP
jgi:CCR4-NOT transcription complex subunit 1